MHSDYTIRQKENKEYRYTGNVPVTSANRCYSYKYSKMITIAMLGRESNSTITPHSPTEKALLGAQLPWAPSLLIFSSHADGTGHFSYK